MIEKNEIKLLIYSPVFAALTAFGAVIRIPVPVVPFTMQTFFVVLAGIVLGARGGFISQVIYIVIGLAGVPVFSQGGGLSYVFKPSFGYIIGFPAAAFISGYFLHKKTKKDRLNRINILISSLTGLAALYFMGLLYLGFYMIYISGVPANMWRIIYTGFIIFLPGLMIKVGLIVYISPLLLRITRAA
ncbi:biotin transporter BioY [candidate division KSB1 bacterium]